MNTFQASRRVSSTLECLVIEKPTSPLFPSCIRNTQKTKKKKKPPFTSFSFILQLGLVHRVTRTNEKKKKYSSPFHSISISMLHQSSLYVCLYIKPYTLVSETTSRSLFIFPPSLLRHPIKLL